MIHHHNRRWPWISVEYNADAVDGRALTLRLSCGRCHAALNESTTLSSMGQPLKVFEERHRWCAEGMVH
jgi:hypothetical protein